MKYPTFTNGQLMESKTHGRVMFCGMDNYMGETTYCFESLTYGGRYYWKPESLGAHLDLRDDSERIAELERENAELRESLQAARRSQGLNKYIEDASSMRAEITRLSTALANPPAYSEVITGKINCNFFMLHLQQIRHCHARNLDDAISTFIGYLKP